MFMINKKRLPVKNGDSWERFSPPHVVWGTLAGEGAVSCNERFNVLDISGFSNYISVKSGQQG